MVKDIAASHVRKAKLPEIIDYFMSTSKFPREKGHTNQGHGWIFNHNNIEPKSQFDAWLVDNNLPSQG